MYEILKLLPCLKHNKDNKYYKEKANFISKKCKKCEFIENLMAFMSQKYPSYALVKCCDVEKRGENQPEAIFMNKESENERIAVEVKSLFQLLDCNVKKDDEMRKRKNRFVKHFISDIGKRSSIILDELLKKFNLDSEHEIYKLLFYGTEIVFSFKQTSDCKYKSAEEEIIKLSKYEEKELINSIVDILSNYYDDKLNSFFKCDIDAINAVWVYKIGEFEFTIGKGFNDTELYIKWSEGNPRSIWYPNEIALKSRMSEYFNDCEKKFAEYNCYKRIFLLKNESRYLEKNLVNTLKNVTLPTHIDELWCSFYEYEEVWNDEKEDFDGEKEVGIRYVNILYNPK